MGTSLSSVRRWTPLLLLVVPVACSDGESCGDASARAEQAILAAEVSSPDNPQSDPAVRDAMSDQLEACD